MNNSDIVRIKLFDKRLAATRKKAVLQFRTGLMSDSAAYRAMLRAGWNSDSAGFLRAHFLQKVGWAEEWAIYDWATLAKEIRVALLRLSIEEFDKILEEAKKGLEEEN